MSRESGSVPRHERGELAGRRSDHFAGVCCVEKLTWGKTRFARRLHHIDHCLEGWPLASALIITSGSFRFAPALRIASAKAVVVVKATGERLMVY